MKVIKCSEQSPESEKALFQALRLLDQVVGYRDDVGGLKVSLKISFSQCFSLGSCYHNVFIDLLSIKYAVV